MVSILSFHKGFLLLALMLAMSLTFLACGMPDPNTPSGRQVPAAPSEPIPTATPADLMDPNFQWSDAVDTNEGRIRQELDAQGLPRKCAPLLVKINKSPFMQDQLGWMAIEPQNYPAPAKEYIRDCDPEGTILQAREEYREGIADLKKLMGN